MNYLVRTRCLQANNKLQTWMQANITVEASDVGHAKQKAETASRFRYPGTKEIEVLSIDEVHEAPPVTILSEVKKAGWPKGKPRKVLDAQNG